ncbi:MAG: Gfo/Idh/MocA family oxidoreductase [Planctomycetota bacterium]
MDADTSKEHEQNRRDFLKLGALAGLSALGAAGAAGCASGGRDRDGGAGLFGKRGAPRTKPYAGFAAPPMERVRIGYVGVGGMGSVHVANLLTIEGAEIRAVCDIVPEKVRRWQDEIEKRGLPRPAGYDRSPRDFERLCETEDLDLVYTATPWEWHVPVCLAAMRNGKHAATEVPAAYMVDDCWALVETAEKYRKHCVMMENCCYDRAEMMVLNMVRHGVLGEVLHAECGYLHDLRGVKFAREGEGLWRRSHAMYRNGNLYPTHGLGPVAQCMDVNRGDRLDYLVSMSGPSRGLQLWQKEHLEADDPRRLERYLLGDLNLTLIRTVRGRTIYLVHDTNLPRPYSRIFLVQGTHGLYMGYPDRFHIEGRTEGHGWDKGLDKYAEEFEHPLWRKDAVREATAGHGGMDWLEDWRLIECLRQGRPTDMDVYDAAAWSVIGELTERSVARRSRPQDVPDFTRGQWRGRGPVDLA